jgi:hypothetical protein
MKKKWLLLICAFPFITIALLILFASDRPDRVSFSDITLEDHPPFLALNDVYQGLTNGLLTISLSGNELLFFPGKNNVAYSQKRMAVFNKSKVVIFYEDTITRQVINTDDASIRDVVINDQDDLLSIITQTGTQDRICFLSLTKQWDGCHTLQINDHVNTVWDPIEKNSAIISTNGNIFKYDMEEARMRPVVQTDDPELYNRLQELIQESLRQPTAITFPSISFANLLWSSTNPSHLFSFSDTIQREVWVDKSHLLIQHDKGGEIFEPRSNRSIFFGETFDLSHATLER